MRAMHQGGFGLIELMVSISVMVIVMSIVLARHSAFNSAVLLRSQAYEVALQLREVQLSSVSTSGDGGNFRNVYGVYFTKVDTPSTNPKNGHYQIFKDANSDFFYDSGEEFGAIGTLDPRFEVRDIRVGSVSVAGDEISIVFIRPNFDALFYTSSGKQDVASVELDIARRGFPGETGPEFVRTIEVTSAGQIAVQ